MQAQHAGTPKHPAPFLSFLLLPYHLLFLYLCLSCTPTQEDGGRILQDMVDEDSTRAKQSILQSARINCVAVCMHARVKVKYMVVHVVPIL